MDTRAVIATHHKTGTVWMNQTFRLISEELDLPYGSIDRMTPDAIKAHGPPAILLASHSKFKNCRWLPGDAATRMIHLIRDPRDVIISAMHYHRTSDEEWLHVPHERLGGKTRQETLNGFASDRERFLFEMDHSAGLLTMRNWNYAAPNCFECKYEDLIADTDAELFARAVTHLGFAGDELTVCREAFLNVSLFSRAKKRNPHIRSGQPRQWPDIFDRDLGRAFIERFGNLLVILGYERDDTWVGRLPEAADREALDRRCA